MDKCFHIQFKQSLTSGVSFGSLYIFNKLLNYIEII